MSKIDRRLTDEQRDLVDRNIGLAYKVGRRRAGSMDEDDAIQEAALGMMDASRRYDPEAHAQFSTYAEYRAGGAVSDAKRNMGLIRISRQSGLQTKVQVPDVVRLLTCGRGDDFCPHQDMTDLDPANIDNKEESVFDDVCRREWHDRFWAAVATLKPRSQAIVKGRVAGKTMKRVAAELGIAESRVSQLEPHILQTLASMMRERDTA